MKKTKILATYGPAVSTPAKVAKLVAGGVNAFRINCSHGSTQDLLAAARIVQKGIQKSDYPIGLLFDIAGPKLRLDRFDGNIQVSRGRKITLRAQRSEPRKGIVAVNHPALISSLKRGERVLIDDGQLAFEVLSADKKQAVIKALHSGVLLPGKGINLPGTKLRIPTISAKDKEDIKTAVRVDADFVALSFVRSGDEIIEVRKLLKKLGGRQKVIAKLEKPEAIDQLSEIMLASDGVMVARGDLGVELPPAEVPRIQKHIIKLAAYHNKTVIIATQMLESMRHSPRPTRAEVNDVASAVFDQVDAVMLSAETATGEYPVESVRTMSEIIGEAEKEPQIVTTEVDRLLIKNPIPLAIAEALSQANQHCEARFVVAFTSSGYTAQLISRLTARQPIVAITDDKRVARRLSLTRSVYSVHAAQPQSFANMLDTVDEVARRRRLARKRQRVFVTGGVPFGQRIPTNLFFIHEVG